MTNHKRPLRAFLCHASSDKRAVRKLYQRLVSDGIDAWLDKEKLIPGQNWQIEISKAVYSSDVVIVCLSSRSVNKEGFVQKEIQFALDKAGEKPDGTIFIVPARLENCDVPERLRKFHWVDLFSNDGYGRLIKALQIRAEHVGAIIEPGKSIIEPKHVVPKPDLAGGSPFQNLDVHERKPNSSKPTIQGYATIHNFLSLPINVAVNGKNVCTVGVDHEKEIPLVSIPATVEYEVIRLGSGDIKWGLKVSASWENCVRNRATLEATNVIGTSHYFYPILTNKTNLAWEVVINEGYVSEKTAGILLPNTAKVEFGYYGWYTNSNVSLHCGNRHRFWGIKGGQGNALKSIAYRSGRLPLTLESHET